MIELSRCRIYFFVAIFLPAIALAEPCWLPTMLWCTPGVETGCDESRCTTSTSWVVAIPNENPALVVVKPEFSHACPANTQESFRPPNYVDMVTNCGTASSMPSAVYEERSTEKSNKCLLVRYCASTCTETTELVGMVAWKYQLSGQAYLENGLPVEEELRAAFCNSAGGGTSSILEQFTYYDCIDSSMACENSATP